jgi:hypothetical protein
MATLGSHRRALLQYAPPAQSMGVVHAEPLGSSGWQTAVDEQCRPSDFKQTGRSGGLEKGMAVSL